MRNARLWLSAGQFALVIAACWWLFSAAAAQDVVRLGDVHWEFVLVALFVNALALGLMGLRLRSVADASGMHANAGRIITLNFQSIFYLFALPLGIGMETARYVGFRDLFGDAPRRDIVVCVLADRALGLLTSVAFATVAWCGYVGAGLIGALTAVVIASIGAIAVLTRLMQGPWHAIATAAATSVIFHGLACFAVWCLCLALELSISPWQLVLGISAGVFGAIIPLALAGVQAGDFVAAGSLTWLGVDTVTALTVATLYYLSRLQGAVIGAGIELKRSSLGLFAVLRADSRQDT